MKKILLLLILIISSFVLSSCTYTDEVNFALEYNAEDRSCIVKNIGEDDYNKLVLNVLLNGKGGLKKEVKYEIGALDSGEETIFDITEVDEETELTSVTLKSYDYYVDVFGIVLLTVLGILLVLLVIVVVVMIFY